MKLTNEQAREEEMKDLETGLDNINNDLEYIFDHNFDRTKVREKIKESLDVGAGEDGEDDDNFVINFLNREVDSDIEFPGSYTNCKESENFIKTAYDNAKNTVITRTLDDLILEHKRTLEQMKRIRKYFDR